MNTWPDSNNNLVHRYLQKLGLRRVDSQQCVLSNFQRFASERPAGEPFGLETIEAWLRERANHWKIRTLVGAMQNLDRFLDWLVANHVLPHNPWSELRELYGNQTAPIVRGILRPDSAQELEALRPRPVFSSHLGSAMVQHVTRMRSLGFRYEREESRLLAFDRYLQKRSDASSRPFSLLVREYADLGATPEARLERLQSGRTLALAMQRHDPTMILPELDKSVVREALRTRRQPYIYYRRRSPTVVGCGS